MCIRDSLESVLLPSVCCMQVNFGYNIEVCFGSICCLLYTSGTQQKQAQKTVIETSPWFDDKDLTLTGVYYYPEHWDESQWERDFKKMHELGFEFTHFAEFAWAQLEPEEGRYDFA